MIPSHPGRIFLNYIEGEGGLSIGLPYLIAPNYGYRPLRLMPTTKRV